MLPSIFDENLGARVEQISRKVRTGHMVTPREAEHALEAWESEGGGSGDSLCAVDLERTALAVNAGWQASNSAGWLASYPDRQTAKYDVDQALVLADEEDRILRCLGAAVIMRWNTIPTKLQKQLFDHASSVGELLQAGVLKGQIARFLHKHKDDAR